MADDRQLLTDIQLGLRHAELRPVYVVDEERRRLPRRAGEVRDLCTVTGRDNLGQAVVLRLLTPRGELSALAHPDYGSRLHELVGRQNTPATRNLARLYILESLQAEPRIAKVLGVVVEADRNRRDRLSVLLQVQPAGKTDRVTVGPFTLEL